MALATLSLYYLEYNNIYITEQLRHSKPNGALLTFQCLTIFLLSGIHFCWITHKKLTHPNSYGDTYSKTVLIAAILFTILLYINIVTSWPPPVFIDGYIDRFSYIENTKLWKILSPFGTVSIPLPIMIGWLFYCSKHRIAAGILSLLYVSYLLLIGQKFGGFLLATFLFSTPWFVHRFNNVNTLSIVKKVAAPALLFFCLTLSLVYYHYSRYSLSEQFGGPFGLIIYRVFGLQGHAFWGAFEEFQTDVFSIGGATTLWEGMPGLMLTISPSLAPLMLERGVEFSTGFFGVSLLSFGFLAFPFVFFCGYLFSVFCILTIKSIKSKNFIPYFVNINFLILFISFIGQGNISALVGAKSLALIIILLVYYLTPKKSHGNKQH